MTLRLPTAYVIVLGATSILFVHLLLSPAEFPFNSDSAGFIEQARSIVAQGNTHITPFGINPSSVESVPSDVYPVGYSLAIAALHYLGLEAKAAALAVNWVATLLLPAALFVGFRRPLGDQSAAIVSLFAATSTGILTYGGLAMSDVFALLVAAVALGIVASSVRPTWIFCAGMLAGFAYVVRSAHTALIVALCAYFLLLWMIERSDRRANFARAIAFFGGCAVVLMPYFISHVLVSGSFLSVSNKTPPSTVPFSDNVSDYLGAFTRDIIPLSQAAHFVGSLPGVLVAILLFGLALWGLIYSWPRLPAERRRVVLLCGTYVFVGSSVVVLARTLWQLGDRVTFRHTLQYVPFLYCAFAAATPLLWQLAGRRTRHGLMIVLALVVALQLASHVRSQTIGRSSEPSLEVQIFANGREHLCGHTDFLVSNWAFVFRLMCEARVRHTSRFNLDREGGSARDFVSRGMSSQSVADGLVNLSELPDQRPITVGLFPGRYGVDRVDLPLSEFDIGKLTDAGWKIVSNDADRLIISRGPLQ